MKTFFHIFIILLLVSCKNPIKNTSSTKTTVKDSLSTKTIEASINTELPSSNIDTIMKVSMPFKINGIECSWKHYITNDGVRFILKNFTTNQVLIDTDFILTNVSECYNSPTYFDIVNKEFFVDINFDGYKDFNFDSLGSNGAMSNSNISYIYDNKTNNFNLSEELSANAILKIDSINRILIQRNEWRDGQDSTIIYFNKLGKIKSTEVFRYYSIKRETAMWEFQEYIKTFNNRIVTQKIDSTAIK